MLNRSIFAAALAQGASAISGAFEGSVPFIIDVNMDFKSDTSVDADINVKVASTRFQCPGEAYTNDGSSITFDTTGSDGDCLGDGIRTDGKDPSKYFLDVNSDGTLTFHSDGYPDLKLKKKALAATAVSGAFEGSVPFIIDVNMDFKSETSVDADINVKVASTRFQCPGEAYTNDGSSITFDTTGSTGDCLGDGIRTDGKDPSKYFLDVNSDGTLTFHSDGYPDLKLKKKALAATAVSGAFEGSVPFIIDVNMDFKSDTAVDADINVKVASTRFQCPGEAYTNDGSKITFDTTGSDGDCLGDGIRTDGKDPSKYFLDVNSDGTLTFHSDGYPDLKLKKAQAAAIVV